MARELVGTVIQSSYPGPTWTRHRFRWTSDAAGTVVFPLDEAILGEAVRLVAKHMTPGSGTYTVALIDDLAVDALNNVASAMAVNASTVKALYEAVGASWARELVLANDYTLRITHTAAATYSGVIDLYLRTRAASRLMGP